MPTVVAFSTDAMNVAFNVAHSVFVWSVVYSLGRVAWAANDWNNTTAGFL
jgi:hypothetical protein